MRSRVVVTGLGVVSSIGVGIDKFLQSLRKGKSGASSVKSFDTSKFPSNTGCEVQTFKAEEWVKNQTPASLGRSSQMAVAAARQALADGSISEEEMRGSVCDVVMGTTDGEAQVFDKFVQRMVNMPDSSTRLLPHYFTAEAISDSIQGEFELIGDTVVLATACSAGNYALGYAYDKIRNGDVDIALCGGSDSQCLKNFGGFLRIGALAPEKCQPFDVDRKGILPGEGAAVLLLESLERAQARHANTYAEVLGYGASCDGHHIMSPNKEGIVACNKDALERSGVNANDVDYICAHGTATTSNDVIETLAMHEIFGEEIPPMSSIKSMIGHAMGAASALSAASCCLALKHGFIPPTINHCQLDPECDIDCVPNESRSTHLRIVQNNAFAFGGNNSIVLLKQCS